MHIISTILIDENETAIKMLSLKQDAFSKLIPK